jgi:hypothetical protein
MIERLANLPEGVTGFRAKGTVTPSDYERAVLPVLQKLGRGSHILYVAGRNSRATRDSRIRRPARRPSHSRSWPSCRSASATATR